MTKIFLTSALALTSWLVVSGMAVAEGDPSRGETAFRKCKICHNADKPQNKIGPHLVNIMGRTAGSVKGYNYSGAMKKAGAEGWVWTPENMHKYLEKPRQSMPGNKMPFPGLRKAREREDLIAYFNKLQAAAK